jgi:hypothetical protein
MSETCLPSLLGVELDYLTNLVRGTGVVVAVVASCLAAPEATRRYWEVARNWTVRIARAGFVQGTVATVWVKRQWDRLVRRRNVVVVGKAIHASAGLGVTASATTSGTIVLPVDPSAPLHERVERLEQHIATLKALHEQNKEAIAKEAADRRQALQQVTERIEREVAAIRGQIATMEQKALLVDASAVPVIGLGIVLTSIPDVIARSSTWTGLIIAAALIVLWRAWVHFWASGPAAAASQ